MQGERRHLTAARLQGIGEQHERTAVLTRLARPRGRQRRRLHRGNVEHVVPHERVVERRTVELEDERDEDERERKSNAEGRTARSGAVRPSKVFGYSFSLQLSLPGPVLQLVLVSWKHRVPISMPTTPSAESGVPVRSKFFAENETRTVPFFSFWSTEIFVTGPTTLSESLYLNFSPSLFV